MHLCSTSTQFHSLPLSLSLCLSPSINTCSKQITHSVATMGPKRAAPRFACFPGEQCQYFIYVESEVLHIVNSFTHALMLWFIVHYVFNLEYCSEVKKVALFVQELLFKLSATYAVKCQKTATFLAVTTDIQNYL